ncbi:glycosyltransferase [Kribbella sp. NPDC050470]|uniref:glycosyltransferase family protein n=1 Tax=unclassified Kribbella TaxID=2644121 RepID=UPI00379F920B
MRVLLVHPGPGFSVHDVYTGWQEGLEAAGTQVATYNLHDRLTFYDRTYLHVSDSLFRKALEPEQAIELAVNGLLSACYQYWPDVVVVVTGFLVKAEMLDLLRGRGHKVVLIHTEQPYETERELALAAHADLNLLNDPVNLDLFKAVAPSVYMPHAYRPHIHKPGVFAPEAASDFAFVGTGFQSRIDFFEAMNFDGVDVALAGNWQQLAEDSPLRKFVAHPIDQCCDNTEGIRLYQSSKAGLNLYRREIEDGGTSAGWAMGPREVEMAATGLFFLRDPRGEGDELFPMLPTFATPEDASDQLKWWLAHEDARLDAAAKAREAIADRTFTNNAALLLQLLEE